MKNVILGSLLVASTTLSLQAQSITHLFIDHSASAKVSASSKEKEINIYRKHLTANILTDGDRVVFTYLCSNTASMSNRKSFVFRDVYARSKGKSSNDLIKNTLYQSQQYRMKKSFVEKAVRAIATNEPLQYQSQILECIPQLYRTAKLKPSRIHVIMNSDMIEASSFRLLSKVNSAALAKKYAVLDVVKVRKAFDLPQNKIQQSVTIDVYQNTHPFDKRVGLKYASDYWQVVFDSFFVNAQINYHTL